MSDGNDREPERPDEPGPASPYPPQSYPPPQYPPPERPPQPYPPQPYPPSTPYAGPPSYPPGGPYGGYAAPGYYGDPTARPQYPVAPGYPGYPVAPGYPAPAEQPSPYAGGPGGYPGYPANPASPGYPAPGHGGYPGAGYEQHSYAPPGPPADAPRGTTRRRWLWAAVGAAGLLVVVIAVVVLFWAPGVLVTTKLSHTAVESYIESHLGESGVVCNGGENIPVSRGETFTCIAGDGASFTVTITRTDGAHYVIVPTR